MPFARMDTHWPMTTWSHSRVPGLAGGGGGGRLGFRVWGLGCRFRVGVWGLGFRVRALTALTIRRIIT